MIRLMTLFPSRELVLQSMAGSVQSRTCALLSSMLLSRTGALTTRIRQHICARLVLVGNRISTTGIS